MARTTKNLLLANRSSTEYGASIVKTYQRADGVDMGRNSFESDSPVGMAKAIVKIVHENYSKDGF